MNNRVDNVYNSITKKDVIKIEKFSGVNSINCNGIIAINIELAIE